MYRLFAVLAVAACVTRAEPVTFYKQIAPIVYQSCAPYHRPGNAAPFSLLTYEDVKKRGAQIVGVTKRRYLPPWLPESGHGDFQDERRLSEEQIPAIEQWVRQGAAAGSPGDAPPLAKFVRGWQPGTLDLVIEATAPYHLRADGPDDYGNFVLPLKLSGMRWVKAIEIRPGNARAVHHASALVDRSRSARMQEKAPGAGFGGMDLNIEADSFDPDSHFLFWKPGGTPWVEPDGVAWRVDSATLDIPAGERDFSISDDFVKPRNMHVLAVDPHAHYLGRLLEGYATLPEGNRTSAAAQVFERALDANPWYTNARYNLANGLAVERQWERAAAEFRTVLEEYPEDEGARWHLRELLWIWADEATLHSDLGTVLARLGRIREAMPQFETALRLDPHLDAARHNVKAAKARLGNQ